jgi:siroheme synthase
MLAIYMGVGAAGHIQARLLAAGIDPSTPVTVVENGTLPTQKAARGTIGRLVEMLIEAAIKGPAMIFVGAHPKRADRHEAAAPAAILHRSSRTDQMREVAA